MKKLNTKCDSNIYMSILFKYFVSSYYVNRGESSEIIAHILNVCNQQLEIKNEFNNNKDFYISQFKIVIPDIMLGLL